MQVNLGRRRAVNKDFKRERIITGRGVEVQLPDPSHLFFSCMSLGYVWGSYKGSLLLEGYDLPTF
jgi:hypothetical protein